MIDLQKKYDDAVVEVVGRLYGRRADVYLIDLLKEMYPREGRFEEVKGFNQEGRGYFHRTIQKAAYLYPDL